MKTYLIATSRRLFDTSAINVWGTSRDTIVKLISAGIVFLIPTNMINFMRRRMLINRI